MLKVSNKVSSLQLTITCSKTSIKNFPVMCYHMLKLMDEKLYSNVLNKLKSNSKYTTVPPEHRA